MAKKQPAMTYVASFCGRIMQPNNAEQQILLARIFSLYTSLLLIKVISLACFLVLRSMNLHHMSASVNPHWTQICPALQDLKKETSRYVIPLIKVG